MVEISGIEEHSSASPDEKCQDKQECLPDDSAHTFQHPEWPSPVCLPNFHKYKLLEEQFQSAFRQLGLIIQKSRDTHKDEKVGKTEADAEWDDPITFELEGHLSGFLSITFSNAIKKLSGYGYTKEISEWAIFSSSSFYGNKDTESNIIEGALALLKMDQHVKMPEKSVFEGLQNLVEYTLLEMILVVRELRPDLSVMEVMWCLLVNGLDLAAACGPIWGPVEPSGKDQSDSAKSGVLKPGDPRTQIFGPKTPAVGSAQSRKPGPGGLGIADLDEKHGAGASKKAPAIHFKRDLLRQKAAHFEKNYRARLTKGGFKAKFAAWESMVLEQSLKSQSGVEKMESYSRLSISDADEKNPGDPQLADRDSITELPDFPNLPTPIKPTDYYAQIPFDEVLQEYVAKDDKDQLLLMVVPLKSELQRELQGWYDWANEKVKQAAQKLGKEREELKTLRQQKEDFEKSKKERQAVKEKAARRMVEMEHALANIRAQIEQADLEVKRLEAENEVLTKEMEDATKEGEEVVVKFNEAVALEQEMLKKLQAWELEKGLMMEKLTDTRRRNSELESQIEKAENRLNQFKVLLSQEEKETQKAEKLLDSLRVKMEDEDALMEARADIIKRTTEEKKQKFEDKIKDLQSKISELKLESDKKAIAALTAGFGPNALNESDKKKTADLNPGFSLPKVPKMGKRLPIFQEISGDRGDIKVERECIMCMVSEVSVVFSPCGHLVLCGPCNDLHEKHGMKDCPSCRGEIEIRVSVRFEEE